MAGSLNPSEASDCLLRSVLPAAGRVLHDVPTLRTLLLGLTPLLPVTRAAVPAVLLGLCPVLPATDASLLSSKAEGLQARVVDPPLEPDQNLDDTAFISHTAMFPAAGILVLLLYLLLFHEIVSQLFSSGKSRKSNKYSINVGYSRPKGLPTQMKKNNQNLDNLWKRMKQATENFRLNGLKQALISKTMAEARAEARRRELERIADGVD